MGMPVLMSRLSFSVVSCGLVGTTVNASTPHTLRRLAAARADPCRMRVQPHPQVPTPMRTLLLMILPHDFAQTAEKCVRTLCWTLKMGAAAHNSGSIGGLWAESSRISPPGPCAPAAGRSAASSVGRTAGVVCVVIFWLAMPCGLTARRNWVTATAIGRVVAA